MSTKELSLERLEALACRLGISCSPVQLRELLKGVSELLRDVETADGVWSDEKLGGAGQETRTCRMLGPDEDPYNAWASIGRVNGAPSGPLAGKTIAIKDNIMVAGLPMRNGSEELEGFVADRDAEVVRHVLDSGGTITGKARCENYGLSGGSHTGHGGPVLNPVDPTRTTGGSSSGCAALVASGAVDMAIGSDQGGSIRIPSSFCGIVGLKPSWGRVPYDGAMAMEPFVDHLGPMSRTVEDNRLLFGVLCSDLSRLSEPLSGDAAGLRIGILKEGFGQPNAEPKVEETVLACLIALERAGSRVSEVSVPCHRRAPLLWAAIGLYGLRHLLLNGEAAGGSAIGTYSSALTGHLRRSRQTKGIEAPLRTLQFLLAAEVMQEDHGFDRYAQSRRAALAVRTDYDRVLESFDVLAMPTTPHAAPHLPSDESLDASNHAASSMASNSVPFNLSHHPAISVPCGRANELPVGLMFVGKHNDEVTLYRAARAVEVLMKYN